MIFSLVIIFILSGFMVSALSTLAMSVSMILGVLMMIMGLIIQMIGVIILYTRAAKTGLVYLLDFAKQDKVIWFFVRSDNTIMITPAIRNIEGFESAPKLKDGIIKHVKSYRLFDHNVRIVREGQHFSTNLDITLYAKYLKSIGIKNMFQVREFQNKGVEYRNE